MQCPSCGNTDLLPKFKCCPQCGSPLLWASNEPKKKVEAIRQTFEQLGVARNTKYTEDNNRQTQGDSQNATPPDQKDEQYRGEELQGSSTSRPQPSLQPSQWPPLQPPQQPQQQPPLQPPPVSKGKEVATSTIALSDARATKMDKETQDTETGQKNKKGKKKGGTGKIDPQLPKGLTQVEPEKGVTVIFHVFVVSNLGVEKGGLHIRANGLDLGDFQINCVDLSFAGSGKDKDRKLTHFSGQFTLSMDRARRGTDYKYVILKKGIVHWEYLAEFPPKYRGIVNRFLCVPDKYLKPGAIWHQFDGVAYIYKDTSWWEKLSSYFRREETMENRKRALLAHLPKWEGFLVNEPGEEMTATEALVELDNLVRCMTDVWVKETGSVSATKKAPADFNIQTVLTDILQPKVRENDAVLAKERTNLNARSSALVSSLAIVVVLKKYKMGLERDIEKLLLKCLILEGDPTTKRCSLYEFVLKEFSKELRAVAAGGIEELCNRIMADHWRAAREWLFAVPLLHFLRGDSKPFQEPDIAGSYKNLEWIGAQRLRIKEFRRLDQQNLSDALRQLAAAFEVDRLLKRTFLHAIPVSELQRVVPSKLFQISDICVALVTFCSVEHVLNTKWGDVGHCVKSMISQMEEEKETTEISLERCHFTTSMCLTLLEVCLKKLQFKDHIDIVCMLIKLLLTSIQRERQEKSRRPNDTKGQATEEEIITKMLKTLRSKLLSELPSSMRSFFKTDALMRELEMWSELLRVTDENQGFDAYRKFLTEELMKRARKLEGKDLVEMFCEMQMELYEKAVGELFTQLAFEAVEKIVNSPRKSDADSTFKALTKKAEKYGELLSVLLTKSWPKDGGSDGPGLDPRTVEFLLTWNPMIGYLNFFGDESEKGGILTDEGRETLSKAKSLLEGLVIVISDASVTVEILLLLKNNKERFLELLNASPVIASGQRNKMSLKEETEQHLADRIEEMSPKEETEQHLADRIEKVSQKEETEQHLADRIEEVSPKEETEQHLADRIEEIEEFQAVKARVLTFTRMCDLIQPVDITITKRKASQVISMFPICDLCERNDAKQITVKFFELPPLVKDILLPLHQVEKSSTFQELWKQHGKKAQTARTGDEVVESVWKPAYEAWIQLVASAIDGSLTLESVDKFFEGYKSRKEDLVQELECMFNLTEKETFTDEKELMATVEERTTQIEQYQQLNQYASAADTIWKFKEAMGFSGDFKVIEDLCNQLSPEFKQKPISSIGERFAEAGRALECLDGDKTRCFQAVIDSRPLVEWLRTTITSTQELKVLVDLALISAGESDMETDRISSLHTSCLGFAPLIFHLKESEESKVNFDHLMKECEPVWRAVQADKRLPEKLFDTSRYLEWLKTVKESHGSVAMTSLVQAEMINSSGVYVVGQLVCKGESSTERGRGLSQDSVVTLTVQDKTYSLDELRDLQSKLMLIAGKAEKGKDEVDKFAKNLEGVLRLATAYINLSESGFVHRMHWSQEFHCSKDKLEGESIAEELAAASTIMEDYYSNWKTKVSNARREYQELNYFTTQQLMLLRKEIAASCHRSDLHVENLQVLALLESVRPRLDSEDLKSATQHAFKDTDLLDRTKSIGNPLSLSVTPSQARCSTQEIPKILSFLNAAEENGFSEQVALSALASLGVDAEENNLLLWCSGDADDADLESLYQKAMDNPVIKRAVFPERTSDAPQEEDCTTTKDSDKSLEPPSAPTQSSIHREGTKDEDNEAEIGEYLTLAQLGNILRELAVKEKETTPRSFPGFLKRGRPNLMLVPKGDVLSTVLALYMHDKQQPLPRQEEVLICTPETTAEEIELLWRRVTGDVEGRFYCLVNADQLDFSVSKRAVEMLSLVSKGIAGKTGEHYALVVICSSENEDRASIVAALDQYRVAAPPCPSSDDLQSYLKKQFKIPPPQNGYSNNKKITWIAAGSLDPEKLCVRVVSSSRAGLGKTLFVHRLTEQLPDLANNSTVLSHASDTSLHVTVPLHGNSTDSYMLVDSLLPNLVNGSVPLSRVFHLDVSPSLRRGLDTLLFNLLVLGSLCDKIGRVWRRRSTDLYVIEVTTAAPLPTGFSREEEEAEIQERQLGRSNKRPFYDLLPTITCTTPRRVLSHFEAKQDTNDLNPMLDVKEFRSQYFQRVYQYLKLSKEGANIDNFTFEPENIDEDQKTCLMLLLSNCGILDPSWSEIRHFVSFLNSQLQDCEQSIFCNMDMMKDILEGFRSFVVRFMIQMSRDFSTPSLKEENDVSSAGDKAELERKELEQFTFRRSWENSPHPYLFFNEDGNTMTFLGFYIDSAGDLIHPLTKTTLEKGLMSKQLLTGLQAQRVNFTANTENLEKEEKINQLCTVMGAHWRMTNPNYDPDRAYELTTDNVKKIMAIHMRFRCNIPVIVMGETGCGKTRLIRYMCGLQSGPDGPRNMLLVKVHGGTTYQDIQQKVRQAEKMARENADKKIDTVLFFDEANTTEALSMIKEVMVDRRICGRPIGQGLERLQFIAACNPYRRHTDDMIHKLESAGLGYHVTSDESDDRLGHIPLRHLVYRVHALPGSMRPLIWDFGQLNDEVEALYTYQIVSRFILHEEQLPGDLPTVQAVAAVLAASQTYMRVQLDECSFVSLRDVERALQVMVWFYNHVETLGKLMKKAINDQRKDEGDEVEDDNDAAENESIDAITRALILAIGVCYHAKLQERREDYRREVAKYFKAPCLLPGGQKQILREITSCQRAVLNELVLGPNIARNAALSENVFMMVVCIELRIPLFVVGKPGSSKSLAKTVVADNMQGDAARSELFKTFKQVHMASYQCSPLSTPEGIVATFRQCSKLQEGKNPDRFVSVVVLDEVGLAEDSPLMPLKTLHPLLEDGVTSADDIIETDEKPQRVAFIGISNWALDPAKMNRGIMLSRGVPNVGELVDSALGICSTEKRVQCLIQPLISPLADGYAELYREQKNFETLKKCEKEEFFGLRDYYSLIKMVYAIAARSGHRPRWLQLEHAIRRNFGGLIEGEPVEIFKRFFPYADEDEEVAPSTTIRLIEASLGREDVADRTNFSENRYLLILTENYAALRIMQQHLLKTSDDAVVIFGSSFPNDQEYTQICRNINRIKVCMETGRTVILLNLESLYESLYDALNQYYVYFGGQKYVDLGLGTHRVKCRVHDDFKLIVIAEKDVVYNSFPIPLINRLEKHFLVTLTSLTADQMEILKKVRNWADEFAKVTGHRDFAIGDAFVGFHEDTIPSIVMQVCNDLEVEGDVSDEDKGDLWDTKALQRIQNALLETAAPDAIARLPASDLKDQARKIWDIYFYEQKHSSLAALMSHVLISDDFHLNQMKKEGLLIQITTHSRLLSNNDLFDLCNQTGFPRSTVDFMTLQQFQTEQQFRTSVRTFFEHLGGGCAGILIVQCDSGDDNFNLIAGARHILMEERKNAPELLNLPAIEPVHIAVVVQLPRIAGGCRNFVGFQGGKWMSTHIDELRPPGRHTPSIEHLIGRPISELFETGSERQPDTNSSAKMQAVTLLRNCVQAAACRLDDEAGSSERSTKRIELLLQLLPEDSEGLEDERTFAGVVIQRVHYLLKEREVNAFNAQGWLHSEALSGTGVQEWGTFRKALWKRVYSAVVPILAEIVALADRDSNLDLLKNSNSWAAALLLKILVNPNIAELSYNKMISPVTNSVRERVQVLGSGAGGHLFQCKFPFSCLIKQRVEKLLKDAFSVAAQSSATVVESLQDLINNSEIGTVVDESPNKHLETLAYLSDFAHMVYKPSSPIEHELVCEAIISSARELGIKADEHGNELFDIAVIHVAHSRIQSRLRCFAKLVQAQPNVLPRLKEQLGVKESEVLLDAVALQDCLEEVNPSEESFLNPYSCRTWCDRMLSIRPAVEEMMRKERFQAVTEINSNYGEKATAVLGNCRSKWQRAGAVRLFVEHVILFNDQDVGVDSKSVFGLWKVLGDKTDFSSLKSLQVIEQFLISYCGDFRKRAEGNADSELRTRCNAFFMELVSLFCFGKSSKDLEKEALSHLMQYVVGHQSAQTKDFSPFPDYGIDPTPVVRSFLLQQLLRSSTKSVKEYLDVFLQEAQSLKPEPQHIKEVCYLCVQCMEDNLTRQWKSKAVDWKLTLKLGNTNRICAATFTSLKDAVLGNDKACEMNSSSLESVAKGRYVLTVLASYLYKCYIEEDPTYSGDPDVQRELLSLIESAKQLCSLGSGKTPLLYLVKQIIRRYGFAYVRTLGSYTELEWIVPPEARQQGEDVLQDRFVVHEEQYRSVREGVAKAVISGNIQDIVKAISESEVQSVCKEVFLLLAFYREVTLVDASRQQEDGFVEVKKKLVDFTENGGHLSSTAQPFARQLLENSQGGLCRKLQAFSGKSEREHTLAEIVIHTSAALRCVGSGSLAEPLYALMTDPSTMTNSYLPTMADDNFLECIAAVAEFMKTTGWVGQWYKCTKKECNYFYFIDKCSNPTMEGHCPECGMYLGGKGDEFLTESGEVLDKSQIPLAERKDRTKTGHALGKADSRPDFAEPQRKLTPILCSLLRIIMHSAMVMGACRNAQATAQLITPPCEPENVAEYLWQHLERDLDVLRKALGLSVDDAASTVHLVLQQMISLNGGHSAVAKSHDMRLQSKDGRRDWEEDFSSIVLAPAITELDIKLERASRLFAEDDRFGTDPLVRLLYEFEEKFEDLSRGMSPMMRSLWKYRRQITVEHLGNSFKQESADGDHYKVLDAFLKQEHRLRLVKFLPDIVHLQRLLMDRFHRRIDRIDAETFTIREFLQSLPRGSEVKDEYSNLIQSFKIAWNSCRSFLSDRGRLHVSQDLCNFVLDLNCPIATLLPSTTGMGVCSTSLVFFLVKTHNDFLGAYRSATNQQGSLERVFSTEVTISHLIAYDQERDLLPLILAHCNYSLEVGKETIIQYDWAALERQLIDRFLRGRPYVEFKDEQFAFSGDTRDETVFASLAEKIPQEPISRVIEGQIISDLRASLSDVCDVLSSLDIAIGFLVSSGGQKERSLKWYLHEVVKLPKERGLKSPTAEQHCNLSHTLALWRLMALEKAKIKTRNKQEPFDQISDIFKEKLSSSALAHLNRVLRKIDMDLFLPYLLEMIVLNVKHAEDNVATMSFKEYLELYLENKGLEQIPGTEHISDDVTMAHTKAVWNSAVKLSDDFYNGS